MEMISAEEDRESPGYQRGNHKKKSDYSFLILYYTRARAYLVKENQVIQLVPGLSLGPLLLLGLAATSLLLLGSLGRGLGVLLGILFGSHDF